MLNLILKKVGDEVNVAINLDFAQKYFEIKMVLAKKIIVYEFGLEINDSIVNSSLENVNILIPILLILSF